MTSAHDFSTPEASTAAVSPIRRDWALLGGLILAYAAVFVAFAPPTVGIEDEVGYLNQAIVWTKGAFTADAAGYHDLFGFVRVGAHDVPARQPGRSLWMFPFLLVGGIRAAMYSGLFLHAATVLVGALVLVRLGKSPLWSALLLFHPTLAIYSRTLMADEGAGLGPLIGALAVVSLEAPWAGVVAGLGVAAGAVFRYHAGLALPVVAAAFLFPPVRKQPFKQAILCLVAGGLGGFLLMSYNLWLFQHPTDPQVTTRGSWSFAFIGEQARFFGGALMTVWPGMLLAPLLDRSALRWVARGVCGLFLAMFLIYYWHDTGSSWIETAVLGLRLIQVALPVWITCYAVVVADYVGAPLTRAIGVSRARGLAALACLGLLLATTVMFTRHQKHLQNLIAAHDAVAAVVPDGARLAANGTVEKLFATADHHPAYERIYLPDVPHKRHLPEDFEERPFYVAVLLKSADPSNLEDARAAAARYHMTPIETGFPGLTVYAYRPPARSKP
ncbi:MAG: hypothetical protein U0794_01365 [Isosphaeraceae bacterium]